MERFIIHKNCHYSNFIPRLFSIFGINYMQQGSAITFTESCKYRIKEKSCVNKLFGFSLGIFGVHKNSIRFGWTYDANLNKIIIWKYVYDNCKLLKEKVFSCNIGDTHKYYLDTWLYNGSDGKYEYDKCLRIDGKVVSRIKLEEKNWFILTLGPYFGGKTRAPHKICIISNK